MSLALVLSLEITRQQVEPEYDIGVVEALTGVPGEIIQDAFSNGLIPVFLYGSKEERHRFAKGRFTRFGRMSFDADSYLKYKKRWSDEKIHELGYAYGFSNLLPSND